MHGRFNNYNNDESKESSLSLALAGLEQGWNSGVKGIKS
jgi:hypothetical protein